MGRHSRPSKAASLVTGTAPAAVVGIAMISAPAAHAQAVTHQRPEPVAISSNDNLKPTIHQSVARAVSFTTITVHAGNTLSGIAGDDCHNPADWSGIADANKSQVKNPNLIYPGEKLVLDCRTANVSLPVVRTTTTTTSSDSSDEDGGGWTQPHHHHASISVASSSPSNYSGGKYSFSGLENLWVSAGGPAWAEAEAARVAECESGGNSSAYNPSGATGLWQILGAVVGGNLDNPYTNALNAVSKFKASGETWAQWVCKP